MVRTRFAPSPTGYLHIGGARTALFSLGLRAQTRRQVHPAHRGHRPRALDAGIGAGDPRRDAVARPRLGRRPVLPDAAPRALPRSRGAAAATRARPTTATPARKSSTRCARQQRARGEKPRYDGRWRPRTRSGKTPPAGRAAGDALSQSRRGRSDLERSGQRADHDRQQRARRSRDPARATACRPTTSAWWSTTSTWTSPT